jgi:hypothetical protein
MIPPVVRSQVLFVAGGRLSLRRPRVGWQLSGWAVGLGMPVTLALIAVGSARASLSLCR